GGEEKRKPPAGKDGFGQASGRDNAESQAEEIITDRDEVRRNAMVAPGGKDRSEKRQQKSGEQKSGERFAASRHTSTRIHFCDVHVLRLYYAAPVLPQMGEAFRFWKAVTLRNRVFRGLGMAAELHIGWRVLF